MGVSKCSQYCEMGVPDKVNTGQGPASGQFSWAESVSVLPPAGGRSGMLAHGEAPPDQEMSGLSYNPPPPPEYGKDVEALLGTPMPMKPHLSLSASSTNGTPPVPWRSPPSQSSRTPSRNNAQSWGRPGEPVNKVYVQFSNDLEGFLPYTLVISEAQGLEFTSLCSSPDFALDPLNIMKVSRIDFDMLMKDAFFTSLAKSIHQSLANDASSATVDRSWPPHPLEERCRPPYRAIVQLNVRRTLLDGCQVLVFIGVQSDPLAEELVQSCHKLKKRRAMRVSNDDPARSELSSRSISRGCPTPRTTLSNAARATPPRTPPQATREMLATPPQGLRDMRPAPVASVAAVR